MTLETLSSARSFGGTQLVCRHSSRETGTDMTFGIYLPPQAEAGEPLPALWLLRAPPAPPARHARRDTRTDRTFGISLPPQAEAGEPLPVLWFLSGLTCTHAN